MDKQKILDLEKAGEYVQMMNELRPGWGHAMLRLIPERMHGGIIRWVFFATVPGDFLKAVISHELFEAYKRADDENAHKMRDYVNFFYQYSPIGCHGQYALSHWKGIMNDEENNDAP
jgi:hypothetical protein